MKNEAIPAININKLAVIFFSLTSSIASFTIPKLERKIEETARIWALNTISNANSKKMEIPSKIAAGIIKYQKFFSKKDSSSSSSQIDDEHATAVIISHLCNECI